MARKRNKTTNVIIGAHNTVTGCRPANFFAKYLSRFCQCQDKDIAALIQAGVTCFDIRIWYDRKHVIHFGHGLAEYDIEGSLESLIDEMKLKVTGNLYIRVLLERNSHNGISRFRDTCAALEREYPDVMFFGGWDKRTGTVLYAFRHESEIPTVHEYHASVSGFGLLGIQPRAFYEKHGKDYTPTEGINLIDFI